VDFWTDHSIFFFLALIFIPRLSMVYFGMIASLSVGAIAGWTFVPRITMAIAFSGMYYDNNPTLIVFFWIIAVISDIVDFILKFTQARMMYLAQMEAMRDRYSHLFPPRYY